MPARKRSRPSDFHRNATSKATAPRRENLTRNERKGLLLGNLTDCLYMCSLYRIPEKKPKRREKATSTSYNFNRMANVLTFSRILLTLPTVIAVINGQFTIALLLFLLGALTDLADGFLARVNGEVSNFGRFLDPLADKILVLSTLVALVDAGRVGSLPVILLLLRELSITFVRSALVGQGVAIEASLLGKFKTSLQFLAVALLLIEHPFGAYLLWTAVIVAYLSAYDYLKTYLRELSGLNYP